MNSDVVVTEYFLHLVNFIFFRATLYVIKVEKRVTDWCSVRRYYTFKACTQLYTDVPVFTIRYDTKEEFNVDSKTEW